jgi:predicted permease
MDALLTNVRYSIRMLSKNSGLTTIILITLALGIGANTTIFSVVYPALLAPLPYSQPEKLFTLAENRPQKGCCFFTASYPDYLDWKRTAKSFQSIAGFSPESFTLTGIGESRGISATQVTTNFFATLGVRPMLGRDFADGEELPDTSGPAVAILSYGFWQSDFGRDPNVIGSKIRLDSRLATIIGVMPQEFEFGPAESPALWVPLHLSEYFATARNSRWLQVIGRLAPSVTASQAREEMNVITAGLVQEYPKVNPNIYFTMGTLRERIVGNVRPLMVVLFGAVGFVLLIACANIANLLMTRSIDRRKEFAIRAALGANRNHLLSQLFTESLILALLAASIGLVASHWGVRFLVSAIPNSLLQTMPYLRRAGMSSPVLLFLCGVTVVTGIVFGLVPSLAIADARIGEVLKDETRGGTSGRDVRLRDLMAAFEIAVSLVLLVGAGLMLQSLHALRHQDTGFDSHNVLTFDVSLPDSSYPTDKTWPYDAPKVRLFTQTFLDRVRNLSGVQGAAATNALPITGNLFGNRFVIEGKPTAPNQENQCPNRAATVGYFEVMKIRLMAGRYFAAADTRDTLPVVIVNHAFVKSYLDSGEDPIGRSLKFTYSPNEPFRKIVGVVGDVAENELAMPSPPMIYYLDQQRPLSTMSYVVRTGANPIAFIGAVRHALSQIDPQLAMVKPQSIDEIADQSRAVFIRRYPSYLIGGFASLALLLAVVGLYGLTSYTVLQRTREIGIRMAIGAQRRDILKLILKQGIRVALAGVVVGVLAGLALTRLMASLLFGINASDWFTFSTVALVLVLVSVIASCVPAQRATRIDPLIALRYE